MPVRTPSETLQAAQNNGRAKINLTCNDKPRLLILAVAAGAYIALGAALSITVGYGFPGLTAENPSLQRLLSGLAFPIGLTLIVILGGELFTGNNAVLVPGMLQREFKPRHVFVNWTLVWLGNFAGALLFLALLVYGAGLFDADPWHAAVVRVAQAKVSMPWHTVLLKGIGANWCVCLAVWMAAAAHGFGAKAAACWLPVAAFVILGYEHCIANMFFIPCGMIYGADVTWLQMLGDNLLWSTAGNIIGGALFVGALHAWAHGRRN